MKLRSQMLLAGALTLAVPLVGWQSVKHLYSALQQTRIDEQTLKVANMRLALSEASDIRHDLASGQSTSGDEDWYAQTSPYPIFIDGYDDDWQTLQDEPARFSNGASDSRVSVRSARYADELFLFISVLDEEVVYHTPPVLPIEAGEGEEPDQEALLANGDSVELLLLDARSSDDLPNWQYGIFRTIAPGPLLAAQAADRVGADGRLLPAGRDMPLWKAAWVKSAGGYQVEISVPLPVNGSPIGIALIDVDRAGEPRNRWIGNVSPSMMRRAYTRALQPGSFATGLVFHASESADRRLEPWTSAGTRVRLFDIHGRLVADVNKLYERDLPEDEAIAVAESSDGLLDAILLRVFAFFVAGDLPLLPETLQMPVPLGLSEARRASVAADKPATSRYVTDENDRVLGTLAPIGVDPRRGYLLFESNEEHSSAYAGSELARLFSLLLLVSLVAGSVLLVFAVILSSRIRRLSREAQHAVTADGKVRGLPGSDAQDEIGDLSRKLSSLLERSAAYTAYLEALSSRLSHELRTPLSVVRTSIENLDRDALDDQSRMLVDRASGGADQLSSIIKALVESTRLEQTVQRAEMQPVNLAEWLARSLARYQQIYPGSEFRISPDPSSAVSVMASPELLSQAFDKLVDNAVSFARQGPIVLYMTMEEHRADLASGQSLSSPGHLSGKRNDGLPKVALAVANVGDPLDDSVLAQLFDPLYSERSAGVSTEQSSSPSYAAHSAGKVGGISQSTGQADELTGNVELPAGRSDEMPSGARDQPGDLHLGLGLYIVRMIADAHEGEVMARYQDGWVMIGLRLPLH